MVMTTSNLSGKSILFVWREIRFLEMMPKKSLFCKEYMLFNQTSQSVK